MLTRFAGLKEMVVDPANPELPSVVLQIAYTTVFLLLVGVTGGIGYVTYAEWRDKRRRARQGSRSRSVEKRKS
ncbi:MAG: hypothetical protein NW237_00270 [Cyanobacteriota bacterium]|nr:hypothetical protein [Cyanobacteriota bacterium]